MEQRQLKKSVEIDFIRAILIILMILTHIVSFGDIYPAIKYGILSFMMPAFLLVTGYLVNINKSVKAFFLYILRLAVPYTIMVTGFSVLSFYLPVRDGLTELTVSAIVHKVLVTSIGPYWFLHTMIVCGTIYYAVYHLAHRHLSMPSLLILIAIAMLAFGSATELLNVRAAAYYFLGVVMRQGGLTVKGVFRPSALAIFLLVALASMPQFHDWAYLTVLFSTYCCISFLLWTHSKYAGRKSADILHYIGANTLPVYLFHPIFTMAAKYCHGIFAFDSTEILFAIFTILLSLSGSLAIAWMLDRSRLSYVFGCRRILR